MFKASLPAVMALTLLGAAEANAKVTTFDPQGSVDTYPRSVDRGAITGAYYDSNYTEHGFLRAGDGTITTFDPPGATSTFANIIVRGKIVGYYADSNYADHGFFRPRGPAGEPVPGAEAETEKLPTQRRPPPEPRS